MSGSCEDYKGVGSCYEEQVVVMEFSCGIRRWL